MKTKRFKFVLGILKFYYMKKVFKKFTLLSKMLIAMLKSP